MEGEKRVWTRQPQEQEGDYWFSGKGLMTAGINADLHQLEIKQILDDLYSFIEEKQGVDYLQVYTSNKGDKIFIIDQLSKSMIESKRWKEEDNHFTILFAHEY